MVHAVAKSGKEDNGINEGGYTFAYKQYKHITKLGIPNKGYAINGLVFCCMLLNRLQPRVFGQKTRRAPLGSL